MAQEDGRRVKVGFTGRIDEFPELPDGVVANSFYKDGDHILVECSDCLAPLADVWITQPDVDMVTVLTANCPHCDDKSFQHTINGRFHLGITDYTNHINQTIGNDGKNMLLTIDTCKGEKKW